MMQRTLKKFSRELECKVWYALSMRHVLCIFWRKKNLFTVWLFMYNSMSLTLLLVSLRSTARVCTAIQFSSRAAIFSASKCYSRRLRNGNSRTEALCIPPPLLPHFCAGAVLIVSCRPRKRTPTRFALAACNRFGSQTSYTTRPSSRSWMLFRTCTALLEVLKSPASRSAARMYYQVESEGLGVIVVETVAKEAFKRAQCENDFTRGRIFAHRQHY